MKRRLTAALLLPGMAALVLVWGCPPVSPPVAKCAAATEACEVAPDCCDGLTCSGGVCVALTTCADEGGACTMTEDCCDGLTCSDGACVAATTCADDGEACTDANDCCEGLECIDGACGRPLSGTQATIPAKTIGFDLMGIHDPDSDSYGGDCIGCHGDRTDEVALDGVTPAAHATMGDFFGEGNDRCTACHNGGPNFYDSMLGSGSLSRGALREQVDMEAVNCAGCHGPNTAVALYAE